MELLSVLDLGRKPIWSRFFETFGEDVYLGKKMGSALVNGYQGSGSRLIFKCCCLPSIMWVQLSNHRKG